MPTTLQHKGVNSTAVPKRAVKLADEGIVRAIVAVTGVVDMVNDLIVPGAFKATLLVRRPKVVDDHEWQRKAGRVLHVEEWMPGDPRLPKRTKDGKPWPKEAGALVATMQYALSTTAGRESFEFVKFYAETNEAEFSIGYKVPDGKAIKRGDGVRVILQVNLFEFSHVLFGAAPLSMALEVKSMHAGTAGTATLPALGETEETDGPDDDTPPPPLPADAVWDDDQTETKQLYASPEVKTALGVVLEAKDGGWDRNAGNAENLRKWYVAGGDGQIPWGADGDFDACVAIAAKHMSVEDAKGYCNLRHHEATGMYPATHAAMEGKDASEPITTEVKAMSRMKGSYQERTQLVEVAARDLFEATYNDPCVCVVATYDTEAVVQLYLADGTQPSYVVPYTLAPDGVALGTPEPVELSLVAEPKAGDEAPVPADVEDVAVVAPVVSALEHAAALAATEGKAAAAVRAAIADLFATETKAAQGDEPADPPADEPADAETPTITRETLPEGDWAKFRKTDPIEALRMDGPFTVETREGTVTCEDGWLAIDSDGYPYPIAAEEFDAVYTPAGDDQPPEPTEPATPAEGDEVAEKSAEDEAPSDPVDDAEPDGDADDPDAADEGTVTLSPDDLYDPDDPEPQPSDEAIDAAIETEQEKSAQGDADTAPPETEDADPAPDEGGTESVTLDPDQHFKDLAELDDEAA